MDHVGEELRTLPPCVEVFSPGRARSGEVHRLAHGTPPPPRLLRTTGLLRPDVADRIAEWFTGPATADAGAGRASYRALERDTERRSTVIHRTGGTAASAFASSASAPTTIPTTTRRSCARTCGGTGR